MAKIHIDKRLLNVKAAKIMQNELDLYVIKEKSASIIKYVTNNIALDARFVRSILIVN